MLKSDRMFGQQKFILPTHSFYIGKTKMASVNEAMWDFRELTACMMHDPKIVDDDFMEDLYVEMEVVGAYQDMMKARDALVAVCDRRKLEWNDKKMKFIPVVA
jgi:hypothetical protein